MGFLDRIPRPPSRQQISQAIVETGKSSKEIGGDAVSAYAEEKAKQIATNEEFAKGWYAAWQQAWYAGYDAKARWYPRQKPFTPSPPPRL